VRLAFVGACAGAAAGAAGLWMIRRIEAELPSVAELERDYKPMQVTRILARDGSRLAELFTERRTVVPIDAIPEHVKLAFLAAEDANFFNHEGLNYAGIARAFIINLRAGRTRQGGSTITQQVVKNILLESKERSYRRKIREALLARRLEQELCPECGFDATGHRKRKEKILGLYLNHIYFGAGRYGIEEAAQYNFGKSSKELSIAEAAMLAGVPAGPELFAPRIDLDKALARRAFVLRQMLDKGFLSNAQFTAANDERVHLANGNEATTELAPEVVSAVKRTLLELAPERAHRGGFTVTTTIDPAMQALARKAVRDNLTAYDKRHGLIGPLHDPNASEGHSKTRKPKPTKVFEGTPSFASHKVYTGTVTGADDAAGTLEVRVGSITGTIKLADYTRYNPHNLPPSRFAAIATPLRVSLLAPEPEPRPGAGSPSPKVPLRLELGPESAMVVVDVRSRHVLALIGSYEGRAGGLDRATQARRQPGSTFKPIVYSYALHTRKYTPATLIDVQPSSFSGNYTPSNYEGWTGTDPLRLREVLAQSVNIGAVRVLDDVGPSNVVKWARDLGIVSPLAPDLSLALGAYEVRPMELAAAYATLAAGGTYEQPVLITRIVGPDGADISLPPGPEPRRVLDPAEAYVMTHLLTSVVDHGTATRAKVLGRPVAGKTGTSNDSKDTWFAGYSADIASVVWVGYDDNKPLGASEAGGMTALPAWISIMKAAHEHRPKTEFPRPPGVVTAWIDRTTAQRLPAGDSENTAAIEEVFIEGTEPPEPDAGTDDAGAAAPAPETSM